ncbi:MAG: NDP-sugar synthase [Acidobacteria bacterium]|nr:NDP-sugar synthase [Acidobacteriota bacterium]MBU4307645.1 NDP-sugar synthase [Acidobacteriota bacterium]MBU4404383.1 NDP-sugar synthase [Acidobacteriota bacterium]MCG2810449.1 NDP-sugar synthase [Candidatus Aminicenantes bacterium]
MKFFILAGGYGHRAEPLSLIKPKPVFPLNGMPLLTLLLQQLRAQDWSEGFINPQHLGEQVVAAADGYGIHFIREKELSGSRVLRQALPFFTDWLLAVNGDTFLEIPLTGLLEKTTATDVDGVLLVRPDHTSNYAGLCVDVDGFLESDGPQPGSGLMYAGVALFRKKAVEKIDEANFFKSIQKNRLRFQTVLYDGIWLDVGTPEMYFQANWEYKTYCSDPQPNAFSGNVEISPASRVEKSVLWENSRIGPGVHLSECIVTGNLRLENTSHSGQIISQQGVFPLF